MPSAEEGVEGMGRYIESAEGGPSGLAAEQHTKAGREALLETDERWGGLGFGRAFVGFPVVDDGLTLGPPPEKFRNRSSANLQIHLASSPPARMLIIDDCTLQRENLATVFAESVPAVAWDTPSVCVALSAATPEIVLVSMGTREGISLVRVVREMCPAAKVVVVGVTEDDESAIVAWAEAGVAGYHLTTESLDDLRRLIDKVTVGDFSCSPMVSAILLKRFSAIASQRTPESRELVLTARELEILQLLELGMSNHDIADKLCIAVHTVKNHVHALLGKLGVSTRAQAAAYARSSAVELLQHKHTEEPYSPGRDRGTRALNALDAS
jgi:DNA-binding NarL/FixJ family response regulator